jgi:voltage-gated potassium channel
VTITTVGYGDISPQTDAGRFVAVLLMVSGLGVLAMMTGVMSQTLVGHIFLLRTEAVRMSLLSNHIIVCGWSAEGLLLLSQLEREHQDGVEILVFAPCERPTELPEHIRFVTGNPAREVELEKVRALYAATAIVVGHQAERAAPSMVDAQTVLTVFTLRAYERRHGRPNPLRICAEIHDPENAEHARVAGADEIIQSSLLASSIMAHASVFPGTSDVLADLLSPHTSQTLYIEALVPQLALKGQTVAHVREALGALGAVFVGTRQRGVVSLNPADSKDIPMDAQIIYVSSRSLSGQVR